MDYKKKYKQLHTLISDLYPFMSEFCKEKVEGFFPELKESEDEKIRKWLIGYFNAYPKDYYSELKRDSILAWLEKQEGCEHIRKEWLEHIKQSWYKEGFIDGKYSGGTSKEWTINDTTTLNELIDFLENGTAKLQHDLTRYANWLKIQFTPIEKQGECHISHDDEIMIKQLTEYFTTGRGLQNTNETVVEWLNDVKEKFEKQAEVESDNDDIEVEEKGIREAFNKIEDEKQDKQKSQRMISAEAKEAMYDKPAWSEEDEEYINDLIGVFDGQQYQAHSDEEIVKWLKSIRLPYNKEWDENDEEMLRSIIATCELAEADRDSSPARHLLEMQLNWLKSIKDRCDWKPSDEQIRPLEYTIDYFKKKKIDTAYLESLYNDLKKLREE